MTSTSSSSGQARPASTARTRSPKGGCTSQSSSANSSRRTSYWLACLLRRFSPRRFLHAARDAAASGGNRRRRALAGVFHVQHWSTPLGSGSREGIELYEGPAAPGPAWSGRWHALHAEMYVMQGSHHVMPSIPWLSELDAVWHARVDQFNAIPRRLLAPGRPGRVSSHRGASPCSHSCCRTGKALCAEPSNSFQRRRRATSRRSISCWRNASAVRRDGASTCSTSTTVDKAGAGFSCYRPTRPRRRARLDRSCRRGRARHRRRAHLPPSKAFGYRLRH